MDNKNSNQSRVQILQNALKVLELPQFVSLKEIKIKYYELSKKYHPDICEDKDKMSEINNAYEILKNYIDSYRYSFDEEEIYKQYPENYHADRFRF